MDTKLVFAAVSLGLGMTLVVLTSVLICENKVKMDSQFSTRNKWFGPFQGEIRDNYYGVQCSYALGLVCALLQIMAFIVLTVKSYQWTAFGAIHLVTFLLGLISLILAWIYQVYVPFDRDDKIDAKWTNHYKAGYWGVAFIVVIALDVFLSLVCAIAGLMASRLG